MAQNITENAADESISDSKPTFNVFISYQWKSQEKIKVLYKELASHENLNVFMDIYKIKAGMNLYSALASNLQQADVILACVSREYVKSKNCEREIIYSDAFNKAIIPLYIEKIPISELGSIGFILVRERFCSLYKNENLFENLKQSNEFKDIIGGIESLIKLKSLQITLPLTNTLSVSVDDSSINPSVIRFRNDEPIQMVTLIDTEEAQPKTETISSIPKTIVRPTTSIPKKNQIASIPINKRTTSIPRSNTALNRSSLETFNFLEIHPVIKQLQFLLAPQVYLDPIGDRFNFKTEQSKRGGESYDKPVGWIRYGLKIKSLYPDVSKWLSKDGNPDEWAVAYQGFKSNPLKSELYQKLFDKNNKFNPHFDPSCNLKFVKVKDINKKSSNFNNECGMGIFCSPLVKSAEEITACFTVGNNKYKMLLQCRVNPVKIRIPQTNPSLYIINVTDHIRPYGLLIKKVN